MGIIATTANTAYREFSTGSSGPAHQPAKADIRALFGLIDSTLATNAPRRQLTANEVIYVRDADGNDANTGATDTAGGAFKTIQGAWDYAAKKLDLAGWALTIKLGPGTYRGVSDAGEVITGGRIFIEGNISNPSSVFINETGAANDCVLTGGSDVIVSGVRMQSAGSCLHSAFNGKISLGAGLIFHTATEYHIFCDNGGMIGTNTTAYTITGGAQGHYYVHSTGWLGAAGITATITGNPNFSTAFAIATQAGFLEAPGNTYTGACTGLRFIIEQGGNISTGNTSNLNYFPGSVAGYNLAGVYDNIPASTVPTPQSFTPTYGGFSTAGTTTQTQSGTYTKMGHLVFFNLRVNWTAHSGGAGGAALRDFPFAVNADTALGAVWYSGITVGAGKQLTLYMPSGETKAYLIASDLAGGGQATLAMEAAGDIIVTGFYTTSA